MDTYTALRSFADSWFLIAMFAFFIGMGLRAFWPGQRNAQRQAALIPFRQDAAPKGPEHPKNGTVAPKGPHDV